MEHVALDEPNSLLLGRDQRIDQCVTAQCDLAVGGLCAWDTLAVGSAGIGAAMTELPVLAVISRGSIHSPYEGAASIHDQALAYTQNHRTKTLAALQN